MPDEIAAIACSRTPKWTLRPAQPHSPPTAPCRSAGWNDGLWKSPAPLSAVSVEGLRSAEPPTSSGTRAAIALMTLPPAERVAIGLSVAANFGSSASHPAGSSPFVTRSNSAARSGCALRYASKRARQSDSAALPRSTAVRRCARASGGTKNGSVDG